MGADDHEAGLLMGSSEWDGSPDSPVNFTVRLGRVQPADWSALIDTIAGPGQVSIGPFDRFDNGYVAALYQGGAMHLRTVLPSGSTIRVTPLLDISGVAPDSVRAAGRNIELAYERIGAPGELVLQRIDGHGALIGPAVELGSGSAVAAAFRGDTYGIVWREDTPERQAVHFLTRSSASVNGVVRLEHSVYPDAARALSITGTPTGFAIFERGSGEHFEAVSAVAVFAEAMAWPSPTSIESLRFAYSVGATWSPRGLVVVAVIAAYPELGRPESYVVLQRYDDMFRPVGSALTLGVFASGRVPVSVGQSGPWTAVGWVGDDGMTPHLTMARPCETD